MAYTTLTLINLAYNLANIVAPELESVNASEQNTGLTLLNALLSYKSVQQKYIPYWQELDFNAVIGQEKYFIPNLVRAETITFNIQDVRYQMYPTGRKTYFGTGRVDDIQSLPYQWRLERCMGGANIYLYFLPQDTYPMKLWGKFALANVTLNQDLSLTIDGFYIEYLRFLLAQYLCIQYTITFAPEKLAKLKEIELQLMELSAQDLLIQKTSTLQKYSSISYADANVGHGWRPG